MRPLLLHDQWMDAHAKMAERFGAEIVSVISDPKKEYGYIRDAVGVTDFSHMQKFRVPRKGPRFPGQSSCRKCRESTVRQSASHVSCR